MSANDQGSMHDDDDGGKARPPGQHAERTSESLPPPLRPWVSEAIGFDSRLPDVPAQSEAADDHFQYEKVTVAEARVAHSSGGGSAAPVSPSPPRPRAYVEPLQDGTILWLTQLPEGLRPLELERLFPRIANKLCGLWATPLLCDQYLTSLLMDSRDGGRQGFPKAVAAELAALLVSVDTFIREHPWGHVKGTR